MAVTVNCQSKHYTITQYYTNNFFLFNAIPNVYLMLEYWFSIGLLLLFQYLRSIKSQFNPEYVYTLHFRVYVTDIAMDSTEILSEEHRITTVKRWENTIWL